MFIKNLSKNIIDFPKPEKALKDPNGLLASGGDLSPERLLVAYQNGIFPWFNEGEPILWWSPDPRAVLLKCHVSRSMKRFIRPGRCPYHFSLNCAFSDVITACATKRSGCTWISSDIVKAYCQLHRLGRAHSVEVWLKDKLVGGLYGISVGAMFCGESMFSIADNASKSALIIFEHYFTQKGGKWIDCQVLNAHTASLGAEQIPRNDFLSLLDQAQRVSLPKGVWLPQSLG
ncbi:MAG: leucyl/phenylalanyl-tRNA--protein transferase [Candidatus Hamiltonella defensa (Ceratovacuna japonica)]